jgi:hypothetical protein
MFAADRDLLVFEPRLFFDVAWTAQLLVSGAGGSIDTAGTTLSLSGAAFDELGIDVGHIVLAGGAPLEVTARQSATALSVSRLRPSTVDPVLPASSASNLKIEIMSFAPQLRVVHDQLLRTVGIEPDHPPGPGVVTESEITNPRAFVRAESFGALHLIFSSAAALVGESQPMWVKAQLYRNRFTAARRELVAHIDLDGDAEPDVARRANVMQFIRS